MADILLVICIIPAILLILAFRNASKKLPPGPLALPIIGHLHLFTSQLPHQALFALSKRHGPLMHIRLGCVPCVVATSPEIAKEFLQTEENSFSNRPMTMAIEQLSYGGQDFSFAPYGPYWKFMKKVIVSKLLGGKTLDLLLSVRQDELRLFIEQLSRKANSGEAVNLSFEVSRFTNNEITRMVMRERCSEDTNEAEDIQKSIRDLANLVAMGNLSDYIWFLKNIDLQGQEKLSRDVIAHFDGIIDKIIAEHEEARLVNKESHVKDLLDILLDISHDETSEIKLSIGGIKAFMLDIFSMATDTSAVGIIWTMSELMNHPDIMEKVTREIDLVVGNDRLVQESDIANLPYLQAVVKESLRLHPPAQILRESTQDCVIGGYNIPAKTRLLVNLWGIGRNPNVWENPLEFSPERFIDGRAKNVEMRGRHFELLTFGTGRRTCPGAALALQVIQTSVAALIQCFEWKIDTGKGLNGKVDMEEGSGVTLRKAKPLVCIPVARHNSLPTLLP